MIKLLSQVRYRLSILTGTDEDEGSDQQWIPFNLTAFAPEWVSRRPVHASVTTCILSLRKVPPCDRSASCRCSLMAECTAAHLGSCCTAEGGKKKECIIQMIRYFYSSMWQWDVLGRTLLMLLGGGRLFVCLSVSTPSSQGNKSFHCFSLKRLSIGTTWPSVVKMYLLSDLWRGLSSSNSCNTRGKIRCVYISWAKSRREFYFDNGWMTQRDSYDILTPFFWSSLSKERVRHH